MVGWNVVDLKQDMDLKSARYLGRRTAYCLELHNQSVKVTILVFLLFFAKAYDVLLHKLCDTALMFIAKSWQPLKERERVRENLQKRFRTVETSTMMSLVLEKAFSHL
jgi:hypothetical protein